jgi:hypothetical protein
MGGQLKVREWCKDHLHLPDIEVIVVLVMVSGEHRPQVREAIVRGVAINVMNNNILGFRAAKDIRETGQPRGCVYTSNGRHNPV